MHAVPTAPTPSQPAEDAATRWAATLQQAQQDALDTIHTTMLRLAAGIDAPNAKGEPPDPRTTTQRIRLCLQAARDLLRFGASTKREDAQQRLARKPEFTPRNTPHDHTHQPTPSNVRAANAQAHELALPVAHAAQASDNTDSPTRLWRKPEPASDAAKTAQTSTNTPPDNHAAPSTTSSAPTPPSQPNSTAPRRDLIAPRVDPDDTLQIMQLLGAGRPLTIDLYEKLQSWTEYAQATGLPRPFGLSKTALEACNPQRHAVNSGRAPPGSV